MAELNFTKSFLTALDSRPVKLPADYVFDPQSFPAPHPFTLPPLSDLHPCMPKKIKREAIPGSSKSIAIHLKSARNPVLHVTLDNRTISSTTVKELKEAVQTRIHTTTENNQSTSVPLDKIKILWNKKPVQGQTLTDVLGNDYAAPSGGHGIEFGVMVLGGAALAPVASKADERIPSKELSEPSPTPAPTPDDQNPAQSSQTYAHNVLSTEEFWDDLDTFVTTKLKDPEQVSQVKTIFRNAWMSKQE
ncbi:hypothetical protein PAAG_08477 [Paracoccidioides lutzii Pb01]|uniref:Ubiquitin-like domain-containing protein n=1 Tax=Paracoccidioides lutzii (strain ATCC MYA-826 / Pb01) TaxID=502779 RepID=C1HCI6_PARBA|nr:hypothetical protein PAAG_08477 [Paracoccidioides lutzii Pb01]EEH38750.1 hypothetical protein PAAG_08477 [Paracoccidioides lutzii Pb01]